MDLQLLTQAWAHAGAVTHLEREPSLEDDTWPEDVLLRLEFEIRSSQRRALDLLLSESERLTDRSFQAGQESAQRRWMQSDPSEGSVAPADKRALLLALYHSPLGGRLGPDAFLVRRSLITEVSVELLDCPHHQESGRAAPELRDALCLQQFHWLRGYFNFLNPAIVLSSSRPHGRCVVSW